jgi:hypothetical protein
MDMLQAEEQSIVSTIQSLKNAKDETAQLMKNIQNDLQMVVCLRQGKSKAILPWSSLRLINCLLINAAY